MNPLISVVIPCFNVGAFIEETLQSVLNQTLQDFEIIVIDDASVDNTKELIQRACTRDHRIKPIFLETNGGQTRGRNVGLRHALGEYVAFLDGDDLWTPQALETRLRLAEQYPSAGVYATDFALFSGPAPEYPLVGKVGLGPRARKTFKTAWDEGTAVFIAEPFESVATLHFAWTGATLVRRDAMSAVGNFNERFTGPEDTLLWLKLAQQVPYVFSPEITAFYRQRAGSTITHWKGPKELQYLKVLQFIQQDSELTSEQRKVVRQLEAECHLVAHLWSQKSGLAEESASHAYRAFRLAPSAASAKAVLRALLRR